jgi:hypothetical protein
MQQQHRDRQQNRYAATSSVGYKGEKRARELVVGAQRDECLKREYKPKRPFLNGEKGKENTREKRKKANVQKRKREKGKRKQR